jgi:hypothetical protein
MTREGGTSWRSLQLNRKPPRIRLVERIFGPRGLTFWQCATTLLALAFAAERFATSFFYSHFGVPPEEAGLGYASSLLDGVVLFVALIVLLNVAVVFPSLLVLGCAWMDIRAYFAWLGEASTIRCRNNAGVRRASSGRYRHRPRLRSTGQEGQHNDSAVSLVAADLMALSRK